VATIAAAAMPAPTSSALRNPPVRLTGSIAAPWIRPVATAVAPAIAGPALRREVQRWGTVRAGGQISDAGVLLLGLLAWSRVHGIVSLEIEGFYDQVGVDPELLYAAEIQHLVDQRKGGGDAQPGMPGGPTMSRP
jgi:Tetracyclin repressor-like, C-terminal domain